MEINLHEKQGEAFLSEATEILYGGAAGGGKSHLMRSAAISWCYDIPFLQVYLFRRITDDLWKTHMEGPTGFPAMLSDWVDQKLVNINFSKGFIEFWNKAKIHLCHCQHEKDVYKYQGPEIHVLMIDESTQWPWFMYTYLRGRVRLGGLKLPEKYKGLFPRILCGANPGGIGHNSVKFNFIDNCRPMEIREMPKKEGGLKRQYIPAKLEDNPTLRETDPDYEYRLEGLGSPELVRAMRHGDWDIVAGGAIDDVWDPEKQIIEPFEIPNTWKMDRSFDWGSSKPFSVGWWAESDGCEVEVSPGKKRTFLKGDLFRVCEHYGWNGRPNEGVYRSAGKVAEEIKEIEKTSSILNRHQVKPGPADTSIWDADDEGKSIASKMQIQGVKWTRADKRPGSRKAGLEELRDVLKSSSKSIRERPGLYIFSTCFQFIRTVPTLPRDQKDMDDVDTKAEDHCLHGDTKVWTDKGFVCIRDMVGTNGFVMTVGETWTKYHDCRKTRSNTKMVKLIFEGGRSIICTPDHKILTIKKIFIEAKDFTDEESYCIMPIIEKQEALCESKSYRRQNKILTVWLIGFVGCIFKEKEKGSIGLFGNSIMEKFGKENLFTTLMGIGRTIKLTISNLCKTQNTKLTMVNKMTIPIGKKQCWKGQKNGTQAPMEKNGIKSNIKKTAKIKFYKTLKKYVRIAAKHILEKINQNIAQINVNQHSESSKVKTWKEGLAKSVAVFFLLISTKKQKPVQENVALKCVRVEPAKNSDSYCLIAEGTHCFALESGIVVHNCYDETRYRISSKDKSIFHFKR